MKLRATDWHKVSGRVPTADSKQKHPAWENVANDGFRAATGDLMSALKDAFLTRINKLKIDNCCQGREESVQDYYA